MRNKKGSITLMAIVFAVGILITILIASKFPCIPLPSKFFANKEFCLFPRSIGLYASFIFYVLLWFLVQALFLFLYVQLSKISFKGYKSALFNLKKLDKTLKNLVR